MLAHRPDLLVCGSTVGVALARRIRILIEAGTFAGNMAVGLSRPTGRVVDGLLAELCVDLGFCLPPDDGQQIRDSPPDGIDAFTDAVITAEGLDPSLNKQQRRQVREVVVKWFARGVP